MVEVLLYVHRNRRRIRDGEPRTATSTFTQLLSSEETISAYVRLQPHSQPSFLTRVVNPCL